MYTIVVISIAIYDQNCNKAFNEQQVSFFTTVEPEPTVQDNSTDQYTLFIRTSNIWAEAECS